MKHLYLIRHANAYPAMPGENDFDRELSEFGTREAPKMAEKLRDLEVKPDLIISSSAKRAVTTARIFAEYLDYPKNKIHVEETLYASSLERLIELTKELNNQNSTVLFFGHNPEFSIYAQYLTGDLTIALFPCGICGIKLDCDDWQMVSRDLGKCILLEYPS
ncbi:MAG: histidine phosphatase family protein [Proteobacteria bacterium]|nr:histidine phosphatase family protein [Pseudomonadota bacterium]